MEKDTQDGKQVVVVDVEVAVFWESDVLPGVIEAGHAGAGRKLGMPTDVFALSVSVFSEISVILSSGIPTEELLS